MQPHDTRFSAVDNLRWQKFYIGSDGFICLIDWMGDDAAIAQAARVSYGAGTKKVSDDRNLIRYLYRHGHTTPFEMCEGKFLVRMPMDVMRQWIRHRTSQVNEYSTRYSIAIDSAATTEAEEWRAQATTNKQGSDGFVTEWPEGFELPKYLKSEWREDLSKGTPGQYLSTREETLQNVAREVYNERLTLGVAREQARKDLPLSTYTEAYWKNDLKNIMNFLSLRMDSHAQQEIREYAEVLYTIVKQICPYAIEAFDDYDFRRKGLLLSRIELEIIKDLINLLDTREFNTLYNDVCTHHGWSDKSREKQELLPKLKLLGIV